MPRPTPRSRTAGRDRLAPIPPPGEHGGDGARVAAALGLDPDEVLDLSATLNPHAPDVPRLAAAHLGSLRRYPDVDEAEAAVAALVGVPADRLVLTAGAAQAIALVADLLGPGWVDEPEFSLYRRHLPGSDPAGPRWRSDPHSPSGRLAPPGDRADVWDEAYLPLSAGTWTRGRPGWAIGSLTKAFACPGLRLGYAIAPDPEAAAALRRRRPAWAVGGLACALVPELAAAADPPGWTRRIAAGRAALLRVLADHGLAAEPSDAPWVLVGGAAGLRTALAREAVVVRDCRSFGLPDHVRIAVPDDAGLERLDRALAVVRAGGVWRPD
ncbi:MAG TPA: aminotransferase class I/II-fold pyridoxal phosphate-dependent enzyme [Acidimicrobiales bacterium]|jgi:histidinol-phosphate/aromatic aminotransferase/cobyric acid decarboxylase-like protein